MNAQSTRPSDRTVAFFVALFLFSVYLLSFNGRITSSDGLSMFAVTESFVKRGEFSTDQMWTLFGTKSVPPPNSEVYSKYGYGTSLLAAPFYALALYFPFSGLMQVTLLSGALATALTAALVVLAARRLGFSALVSAIVTLLFGLATPAWVYAKEFWSEPFAALTLCAAFYFLLLYRSSGKTSDVVWAGIALGLAVTIRTTNVILVPLYAWYTFVSPSNGMRWLKNESVQKEKSSELNGRRLAALLVPLIVSLVSVLLYNYLRFQNPFTTGYRADEDFNNNILLGAYGLLFSPGKGLFVYAPFLAAVPFGIWQFFQQQRRELAFILIFFSFHLILFSAWYYWWGGTNWAARFLVPTLPFLVLLCAPLVKLILEQPSTTTADVSRLPSDPSRAKSVVSRFSLLVLRLTFAMLILLSLINELAGVTVNSLTYRSRAANVAPNVDWDTIFVPALSPLIGHWQTLRPTNLDVAWAALFTDPTPTSVLAPAAGVFFLGWAAIRLIRTLLGYRTSWQRTALALGTGLAATLFFLVFYADDPRLGGNAGYADLLKTLEQQARAREILILNDDARARYFFNSNRAGIKWYGLSRDPERWDETTRQVIAEQITRSPRVWFAYDDSIDAPNPMRDWFASTLHEQQRFPFENEVFLVVYTAK